MSHFWSPHSSKTSSSTAALEDRDFLGGWSAQASDKYARVAVRRTTSVIRTIMEHREDDRLGEDETILQLDSFLETLSVPAAERFFLL